MIKSNVVLTELLPGSRIYLAGKGESIARVILDSWCRLTWHALSQLSLERKVLSYPARATRAGLTVRFLYRSKLDRTPGDT